MDTNLTKQLIASRDVLRDKLRSLKSDIAASQTQLESTFAPITNPLKDIVHHLSQVTVTPKSDDGYDSDFNTTEVKPIIKRPRRTTFLRRRSFFPKTSSTPTGAKRSHFDTPTSSQAGTKKSQVETPTMPRSPQRSGLDTLELEHIGTIEPKFRYNTPPSFAKPPRPSTHSSSAPAKRSRFEAIPPTTHTIVPTPMQLATTGVPQRSPIVTRSQVSSLKPPGNVIHKIMQTELEEEVPLDVSKAVHAKSMLEQRQDILKSMITSPQVQAALHSLHHIPAKYVTGLTTDIHGDNDTKYGIRHGPSGLMIGNADVTFKGNDFVIGGTTYRGYTGMYELLFKKRPKEFTVADSVMYRDILKRFHVANKDYKPNLPLVSNQSSKYKQIIAPLLAGKQLTVQQIDSFKKGYGILKDLRNAHIEYEYWDDPNELVDRLRLLKASERAGNNNHTNEIIAIIEELKEANLIK